MKYFIVIKAERCRVNGVYYNHPTYDSRRTNNWEKIAATRNVIFVKDLKSGKIIIDKENREKLYQKVK